jgi:chorismate dehydratase
MPPSNHPTPVRRLGVVSFLNSRPLIEGLANRTDIELTFAVPSALAAMLEAGRVDAALLPVIDLLQNSARWQMISDACIGCDGPTLTVRVFSHRPPEQITELYVDGDSHTSVALARVIWSRAYDIPVRILPLPAGDITRHRAVLLIGDKVVEQSRTAFRYQLDLGEAWKQHTGLPFVFACWVQRKGHELGDLDQQLCRARDRGVAHAHQIAEVAGPPLGWPIDLAVQYLTDYLRFTISPTHQEGLQRFFEACREMGLAEAHSPAKANPDQPLALPAGPKGDLP